MRNIRDKLKIFMLHSVERNTRNLPAHEEDNCFSTCQKFCFRYGMDNEEWYDTSQLVLTDIIMHIVEYLQTKLAVMAEKI